MLNKKLITAMILLILFLAGCSGSGTAPTSPSQPADVAAAADTHFAWGLWQFNCDPAAGTVDVV